VIDLIPDSDQQQIIDSVSGYLAREFPLERLRPAAAGRRVRERDRWADLAAQGWFGLGLSPEAGGAGFTVVEEMLAWREFGRFLVSPSILATSLAAHLAQAAGELDLAAALANGETHVALASPAGRLSLGRALSGELHLMDSEPGDLLLAWDETGMALFERAALTDIRAAAPLDGSLTLDRARAEAAPARLFLSFAEAPLRHRANLLLSAGLVGMAEAARDLAVAYAGVRTQFGKLIGSFQAVAHHCADMELRARAARAQTAFAAIALRDGQPHAAFQVPAAAIIAADAAVQNATLAIRVHGAMGYTAECDVHHYLKRAHVFERLNGGARARQAALLAEPAPDLSAAVQA
jgi:alkylation response protein AidB-like acyl-CoA dehydrogenase